MLKLLPLIGFFCLIQSPACRSQASRSHQDSIAFSFTPNFSSARLNEHLFYQPGNGALADSLMSAKVQRRFKPFSPGMTLIGSNWFYFRLANFTALEQEIVIEVENTTISQVRLYGASPDRVFPLSPEFSEYQMQRPFKNNRHYYSIMLTANSVGEYFIFVNSSLSFRLPLIVSTPVAHAQTRYARNLIYGPYYGVLIFVLLFSISLSFAFSNERIYLYYSLYILASIVLFLDLNGFGIAYLWKDSHKFDYEVVTVSGAFVMVFFLKFVEHFLQNALSPFTRKMFLFFFYAFIANVVISSVMIVSNPIQVVHFIAFEIFCIPLFFAFLLVISMRAVKRGFKPAIFLIGAVFFLLLGLLTNLMRVFEWIPNIWISQHAVQLGNLLEIMTLTIGVAYWFRISYDERQKLLIKVGDQQREMATEKERIARDLHDNIGTQLTSLSLGIGQVMKDPQAGKLKLLQDHTNAAMLELRDTIWVINKEVIFLSEFVDKVNNLLWRLRQNDESVVYEIETIGDLRGVKLWPNQAINLFRILQEALGNCGKHSKASRVALTLACAGSQLELAVEDDGAGFDPEGAAADGHYGLANMKKRAESCSATFTIRSAAGKGTLVSVVAPLYDTVSVAGGERN